MKLDIKSQLLRGVMPDYPICNPANPIPVLHLQQYSMSILWLVIDNFNLAKWSIYLFI